MEKQVKIIANPDMRIHTEYFLKEKISYRSIPTYKDHIAVKQSMKMNPFERVEKNVANKKAKFEFKYGLFLMTDCHI